MPTVSASVVSTAAAPAKAEEPNKGNFCIWKDLDVR